MPQVPPDEELVVLRARVAELEAQLAAREAQLEVAPAQITVLAGQAGELRRRLGKDSSASPKPPSSGSPYPKEPKDRSLRRRSGRRPGKQPGASSSALRQSPDPDERVECWPTACGACGADLAGAEVAGVVRRQVFEAAPPPPEVIGYRLVVRCCPASGETTAGVAPEGVTSLVQYGPGVPAGGAGGLRALPAGRPRRRLVTAFTGVSVPAGFIGIGPRQGRREAGPARLGPFMDRVSDLPREACVLYAGETPARAAGGLRYVHVACTGFLTAMHAGGRPAEDIDAGGILPGCQGTIVRDGYAGYEHLPDGLHPWCGAHGLRDLKGLYEFGPEGRVWARSMAGLLIGADTQATAARAAGQARLPEDHLDQVRCWYRGAVAKGISASQGKRRKTARDGLRLARRFRGHQDMILRFATGLAVGFTSNQAERDARPVKVQQRTSGGCWRTLQSLAGFAVVRSCLPTAATWGIDAPGALTRLFTTGPWLPPAAAPP